MKIRTIFSGANRGALMVLNLMEQVVGMVADSVLDVITLRREQIKAAPDFGAALSTDYLIGFGSIDPRMSDLGSISKH